ncbi:trans-sulfuration enzyme family protein [Fidelibacter multiformis]|jgi:methionine-gamma-lyase|uniref:trans-sulfuration enzyme family protein n=1 Tax=Fidelibacter multiformis TaxID=3377529 RepID=UPI0037DD29B9
MDLKKSKRIETICVHGKGESDPSYHAVIPPLYQTTAFAFESTEDGSALFTGQKEGYFYSRMGNPTVNALCRQIARLENTESSLAFASGMAAIAAVIMALIPKNGKVLASHTLYGGTHCLFTRSLPGRDIETVIVEDDNPETFRRHLEKDDFQLIFLETPSNPTLSLVDIQAVCAIAREKKIPVMIDNTFATPIFQRPADLGVDIVVHSATKYICGHGDVIAGIVTGKKEMMDIIRDEILCRYGPIISPFDAWLLLRGLKTLSVRMERHEQNAMKVAQFLHKHPRVKRVYYPGLPDHPGHDIARRQMTGFGGVVSFDVGDKETGIQVINRVRLFTRAVSIGECDSLIQHPASITHSGLSDCELEAAGINPGLIRLSIGLEHADDLIEDLEQALNA